MQLWSHWWSVVWQLRPACSRLRSFLWFATCVAGMTVRTDLLGVSSTVRALGLKQKYYVRLLDSFHSSGIKIDAMTRLWAQVVLQHFPGALRVRGRLVLVGDGIKIPKRGRKMPAVKLLHQESDANTKPEFIMGHSFQAVAILVSAAKSTFAVPLASRIHEGVVLSNRDKRTLLDKMVLLLDSLCIEQRFYFVADAYYASGKVIRGLLREGNHLVTRAKSNAVAYHPAPVPRVRKRGRPKKYGRKVALRSLFADKPAMQSAPSPVYGERNVTLRFRSLDLLWRPVGILVRFVLVDHPARGKCILMSTDLSLDPLEIVRQEVTHPVDAIAHVDRRQVHVRSADKPDAHRTRARGRSRGQGIDAVDRPQTVLERAHDEPLGLLRRRRGVGGDDGHEGRRERRQELERQTRQRQPSQDEHAAQRHRHRDAPVHRKTDDRVNSHAILPVTRLARA